MKRSTKSLSTFLTKSKNKLPLYIVLLICVGIGLYTIFVSHASTPYISSQAESGTRGGQTNLIIGGVTFGTPQNIYVPPTSINDTCTSDATSTLNTWIASIATQHPNAVINLPTNACYSVSNSDSSLFAITKTSHLTINGNGATFEQTNSVLTTYLAGGDPKDPVLALNGDTGLTINNLTLKGPPGYQQVAGDGAEGNVGLLIDQQTANTTLNNITITQTAGDGIDLYANNPDNSGGEVTNITVNHATLENIGYHAIVPENDNGFLFENSTVTSGNVDAEVDTNCQGDINDPDNCGTLTDPNVGSQNMTFNNDSFPNGLTLVDEEGCMPVANWAFTNNNFGTGGFAFGNTSLYSEIDTFVNDPIEDAARGWTNSVCPLNSGLTITGNTDTSTTIQPAAGGGSSYIEIGGWTNVNISNNNFVGNNQGIPIGQSEIDDWGSSNVTIENNNFANYYNIFSEFYTNYYTASPASSPTPPFSVGSGGDSLQWPVVKNVTICGNKTGPVGSETTGKAC
jgi:hypothetical protein